MNNEDELPFVVDLSGHWLTEAEFDAAKKEKPFTRTCWKDVPIVGTEFYDHDHLWALPLGSRMDLVGCPDYIDEKGKKHGDAVKVFHHDHCVGFIGKDFCKKICEALKWDLYARGRLTHNPMNHAYGHTRMTVWFDLFD